MNFTDLTRSVAPRSLLKHSVRVMWMGLLGSGTWIFAQSITAPAPTAPLPTEEGPGAISPALRPPPSAPWQRGSVGLRPHVSYRLSYGDGVQSRPGSRTSTTIQTISPGMAFDLGTRWTADYTPSWTYYSSDNFSNTVAHTASIHGTAGFTDGSVLFGQTYARSSDPLVETGRQTRQETANTSLSVNYALGRQSRLQAIFGHDLRYASGAPNTRSWTNQEWLHYQVSSRVDAAVGIGLGWVNVDPGADMRYTEPQARIGWRPVDKINVDVHGGREHRTFRAPGLAALNNPTYGASIHYQPVDVTSVFFSADRGVSASYFQNQVNERSSWNVGFDQRLLERFHLNVIYGRSRVRYIPAAAVLIVGRDDEISTFNLRLSTSFLRRGTIGLFYQRMHNSSNVGLYQFSSDQSGLEIGYRY